MASVARNDVEHDAARHPAGIITYPPENNLPIRGGVRSRYQTVVHSRTLPAMTGTSEGTYEKGTGAWTPAPSFISASVSQILLDQILFDQAAPPAAALPR